MLRFSKEKIEIAQKDSVKYEYLRQKIRMANDQIGLLENQASYLRGDDASDMLEEIKRKSTMRDQVSNQLDSIQKSKKDRIAQLQRTFSQMIDDAALSLDRRAPLYQIEKIDPDIESINNQSFQRRH